jgi:hypothetical protein
MLPRTLTRHACSATGKDSHAGSVLASVKPFTGRLPLSRTLAQPLRYLQQRLYFYKPER